MSIKEFNLPDPGEGLTEADIVSWKVQVGDVVKVNDIVVEIETAKSLVELPVPFAGRVEALLVEEGTEVAVGTPIIAIQTDASAPSAEAAPAGPAPAEASETVAAAADSGDEEIEEGKIGGTTSTGRTAVLVGYGVKQTEAKRRPRSGAAAAGASGSGAAAGASADDGAAGQPSAASAAGRPQLLPPDPASPAAPSPAPAGLPAVGGGSVLAKPPVRKLAKDLGVDLASIVGSGAGGIVTRADVEGAAAGSSATPAQVVGGVAAGGPGVAAAGSRGETRVPIKGVRKVTAQAMVDSAFTAPHVTEWVTCDVSATMELVDRLKADKEFRDVKVTPLLILAKAMCIAVKRNPEINVSWDEATQEIVTKHYVNLGIAAATPRGLMVPNIKDADTLSLHELAQAIGALTATAREGRTPPADMAGGTITITNVGVFGVDTGTPILNPGEAAIVAFGAVRRMPWVVTAADGAETIEPRWVTQLGMSFDHRMVDGELGSRYLADIAAILSDPSKALVWG